MFHFPRFPLMWLLIPALLTIHVAICLLLVLVVLMQLPRSEGLGAAFGGAVTENMFGAQTTHVLARFTVWLGVAFFVVTLALAMAYAKRNSAKSSPIQRELMQSPPAAAAPAALPAATPAVTEPAPVAEAPAAVEPAASPASPAGAASVPVDPAVLEVPATPAPSPASAAP
jgi:preprotein translocase subunit SecG